MISVCGTIMATLPFIAPIIPSIIAGSPIGLALGLPLPSGSARNLPSLKAATKYCFRARKEDLGRTEELVRRLMPRRRERVSRSLGRGRGLGADWRRMVR
jgi:hypothetical protein